MTFFNTFRFYAILVVIIGGMLFAAFLQLDYFHIFEVLLYVFISLFIIDGGITIIKLKRTAYDTPENSSLDFSLMTPGTDAQGVFGIVIANLIGPFLRNKNGVPAIIIGFLIILMGIGLLIWTICSLLFKIV